MSLHFPPTWTDLVEFLDAFWPQLVATALGVILGIPAALWIERRVAARRARHQAAINRGRVASACAVVVEMLALNIKVLRDISSAASDKSVNVGRVLRTSGYHALSNEIALIDDSVLRSDLAHWFETADYLQRCNAMLAQAFFAPLQAGPVGPAGRMVKHLGEVIVEQADALMQDSVDLETRLRALVEESEASNTLR